ncbi:hypothetical protein LPC08_09685 [Roseomonas sp. OT10]|uniref:hypothetical protein n=1 Tax=Roseomonas cutis TaxID=2897332 RepID=UPI001E342340|nr:hypothetical protein [Roseomonas sp. OT10]UFN50851.1 hypothetical protein LPC08_09685 [Roseomonas sp. OT10]
MVPLTASRGQAIAAILLAGLLLIWPAFANRYPLLFSDSGAFLHQTTGPLMIWDKPWIYGPMLHAFHWGVSLWPPVIAQGLMLSHLLWLTQRAALGEAQPARHLLLCAATALLTTAPWSAAMLMPDILAPVTVLGIYLLGLARDSLSRGEAAWVALLTLLAIASHLSHLPLAAALVVLVMLLARSWRPALRAALPLAGAVVLLLATNAVGHGRLALSPHGATFLLARLVANGTAARTIEARCPDSGWYLCAWAGRLPTDSDVFLWEPDSPVNMDAEGRSRFLGGALLSGEAREIVAETLRREPLRVALDGLRDAARQLFMAEAGDTLSRYALGGSVPPRLAEGFRPGEGAAYTASAQVRDALAPVAEPFRWPHRLVLVAGALALLGLWWTERAQPRRLGLILCVLVGITANAVATGALSGPHDRYQARIAWLMPFVAMLLLPLPKPRRHLRRQARPPEGYPGL